jgi:hypothetical protein
MNYLKLTSFEENKATTNLSSQIEKETIGEYLTYNKNIIQKKNNELNLKDTFFDIEYKYNNFGYSENGKLFAFIYKGEALVLLENKTPVCVFPLPNEIRDNIKDFVNFETRGFFKKLFSRLSFLKINHKTNNIYVSNTNYLIVSSCKILLI